MQTKVVVITGASGQDGSYMAEYCLRLGHQIFAVVRRTAQIHDTNYRHLLDNPNFTVLRGDLLDASSIDSIVQKTQPDYFINFAAQSFVGDSWQIPEETFMVGAVGVLRCLEAIRKYAPRCRFYNAGSSEQFGDVIKSPQDESHPFRPRSPYGAAKCAAHNLIKVWRESYSLYAVQGMLFNHESERRGVEFVTRKITKGIARIKLALDAGKEFKPIELGNIESKRDWSHAEDFIDGVWRMLNQERFNPNLQDLRTPFITHANADDFYKNISPRLKDYVLSSNETHTISEFVQLAFKHAGINGTWINGTPLDHPIGWDPLLSIFGILQKNGVGPILVTINPKFYRPAEVNLLWGDSSAARKDLGWSPRISFDDLVKRMVNSDLNEAKKASST